MGRTEHSAYGSGFRSVSVSRLGFSRDVGVSVRSPIPFCEIRKIVTAEHPLPDYGTMPRFAAS